MKVIETTTRRKTRHQNIHSLIFTILHSVSYHLFIPSNSFSISHKKNDSLSLNLLPQSVLQCNGISSKVADTFPKLLSSHGILVEVESEVSFVVDVTELLDIESLGSSGIELLWNWGIGVHQLFKELGLLSLANGNTMETSETYSDGKVITASQLSDLTNTSERSTHNDSLIAVFLVVVEDRLYGGNSGIVLLSVGLIVLGLEPVHDSANEGGYEEGTALSGSDGLDLGKHEGKIAVDCMVTLKDAGGLDTLPCGGNLDEDAGLVDSEGFVELNLLARAFRIFFRSFGLAV